VLAFLQAQIVFGMVLPLHPMEATRQFDRSLPKEATSEAWTASAALKAELSSKASLVEGAPAAIVSAHSAEEATKTASDEFLVQGT